MASHRPGRMIDLRPIQPPGGYPGSAPADLSCSIFRSTLKAPPGHRRPQCCLASSATHGLQYGTTSYPDSSDYSIYQSPSRRDGHSCLVYFVPFQLRTANDITHSSRRGHVRPLCAFVARVVQIHPVYVTFLIAGDNVSRVRTEITQYFVASEHRSLMGLIRLVWKY